MYVIFVVIAYFYTGVFDFVIVATLAPDQSLERCDAIENISEHLLNKDKQVVETNFIHIFGDYFY
jgi:hypothetical protein